MFKYEVAATEGGSPQGLVCKHGNGLCNRVVTKFGIRAKLVFKLSK